MTAVREWYAALDPGLRDYIRERVLCLSREPTDEQIAELPDLIKPAWKLDAMQIAEDRRAAVLDAIAELATRLKPPPRRKRR